MKIKIFIIVPCYNHSRHVQNCFSSISKFIDCNSIFDYCTVFINDGSSDDSREVINNLIKTENKYEIKLINKVNGGLAAARNSGINFVYNYNNDFRKYILFLDVDDELVVSNIMNDFDFDKDYNIYSNMINEVLFNRSSSMIKKISMHNPFVVSCLIIKFDKLFLFDKTLTVLEDWDFWISEFLIKRRSYSFHNQVLTKINVFQNSLSANLERMYQFRGIIGNKYVNNENLSCYEKRNFRINSLFGNKSTLKKIFCGFIYSFPNIFNRVYIKLLSTIFISKTRNKRRKNPIQ